MMDAFWAVPEWAPENESHLLGSSSVVTRIRYGKGSVTYSTFDLESDDVLRLDFVPQSVTAGGKPIERRDRLSGPGYTFDDSTGVLRVRHEDSREIDIQGEGGGPGLQVISFDDPHLAAGTVRKGDYPAGVIYWGDGQWRMHVPQGKFGTFNLALADPGQNTAEFRFNRPRVLIGFDAYNAGDAEATITVRCLALPDVTFTVGPGELRRLRTEWLNPGSKVVLQFKNAEGLLIDNLSLPED